MDWGRQLVRGSFANALAGWRAVATAALLLAPGAVQAVSAPYPSSTAIPTISFRWETHRQLAPGSDNWPLTWSADDDQYTAFGDGGGFGGTDMHGRASLGIAKVVGPASAYRGQNILGGVNAEAPSTLMGKSHGLLAIGTELYLWRCGAGSGAAAFEFQQLHRSQNGGVSWQAANWLFPGSLTFYCPTFLQFGKGYAGARDDYVYAYAAERNGDQWEVPVPGRIILFRVPKDRLMERAAYEFFAGQAAGGEPRWSPDVAARVPVFTDPNGAHRPSAIYNPGLRRYLLVTEHAPKGSGKLGIFDAPEPWGPWTKVLYEEAWGTGHIPPRTFHANFSPKWWSSGGKGFVLVFTGDDALDSWNSVEGSFTAGPADEVGPVAEESTISEPDTRQQEELAATAPSSSETRAAADPADPGDDEGSPATTAPSSLRQNTIPLTRAESAGVPVLAGWASVSPLAGDMGAPADRGSRRRSTKPRVIAPPAVPGGASFGMLPR